MTEDRPGKSDTGDIHGDEAAYERVTWEAIDESRQRPSDSHHGCD